jgi:predicted transcriptional regulator of viral defense system
MDNQAWGRLKEKLYFTTEDVALVAGITEASAYVLCSRYAKRGILVKLKKNFYILEQNWERYALTDFFRLANFLQVPSYISCMSALSFYGVTTQVQQGWIESIALKRSIKFEARGTTFSYYKIKKEYYFGFEKKENFFIAPKEKALIDAVYLSSFGKYPMDVSSIDTEGLDKTLIKRMMEPYPPRTQNKVRELCRI